MGLCAGTHDAKLAEIRRVCVGSYPDMCIRAIENIGACPCNDIRILKHIHEFMKSLSESKWGNQVLPENSIEDVLGEYARLIDEAAQSLQVGLVFVANRSSTHCHHAASCTCRLT